MEEIQLPPEANEIDSYLLSFLRQGIGSSTYTFWYYSHAQKTPSRSQLLEAFNRAPKLFQLQAFFIGKKLYATYDMKFWIEPDFYRGVNILTSTEEFDDEIDQYCGPFSFDIFIIALVSFQMDDLYGKKRNEKFWYDEGHALLARIQLDEYEYTRLLEMLTRLFFIAACHFDRYYHHRAKMSSTGLDDPETNKLFFRRAHFVLEVLRIFRTLCLEWSDQLFEPIIGFVMHLLRARENSFQHFPCITKKLMDLQMPSSLALMQMKMLFALFETTLVSLRHFTNEQLERSEFLHIRWNANMILYIIVQHGSYFLLPEFFMYAASRNYCIDYINVLRDFLEQEKKDFPVHLVVTNILHRIGDSYEEYFNTKWRHSSPEKLTLSERLRFDRDVRHHPLNRIRLNLIRMFEWNGFVFDFLKKLVYATVFCDLEFMATYHLTLKSSDREELSRITRVGFCQHYQRFHLIPRRLGTCSFQWCNEVR